MKKNLQSEIEIIAGNIFQHPVMEREASVHHYWETKGQKQTKEAKF